MQSRFDSGLRAAFPPSVVNFVNDRGEMLKSDVFSLRSNLRSERAPFPHPALYFAFLLAGLLLAFVPGVSEASHRAGG